MVQNLIKLSWKDRLDVFSKEREGKFCLKNKNWSKAEEIFSQLIDYGNVYWVYLGQSLLGQGKYKEARECFEKVLPQASSNEDWAFASFKGLGQCCCYLGDDSAAFENLNKAVALKRNIFDHDIHLCYGILLKNKKNYEKSKKQFQRILEQDSKNDSAWAHLAEVRVLLGDFELAYMNLQQALDLNPDNKTALGIRVRYSIEFSEVTGCRPAFLFRA